MVDVIKFCPGARHSESGWRPVVRVFRNNKPVGSKVGPPMASREAAEGQAGRAANDVARSIAPLFNPSTRFVVAFPPLKAPPAPEPLPTEKLSRWRRLTQAAVAPPA